MLLYILGRSLCFISPKKATESSDWVAPQPHNFFSGEKSKGHQVTLFLGAQLCLQEFLSHSLLCGFSKPWVLLMFRPLRKSYSPHGAGHIQIYPHRASGRQHERLKPLLLLADSFCPAVSVWEWSHGLGVLFRPERKESSPNLVILGQCAWPGWQHPVLQALIEFVGSHHVHRSFGIPFPCSGPSEV